LHCKEIPRNEQDKNEMKSYSGGREKKSACVIILWKCCKKPKETDSMLMLKKDNEHNQLGFQLNTYGMDLSEYTFID